MRNPTPAPQIASAIGGVGVVIDFCANVEGALHFRGERKAPPTRQIGRIQNDSANRIERAWRADADSGERVARLRLRCKNGMDRSLQRGETNSGSFTGGHWHTRLEQDCSLGVDESGSDFGSADVDAEG